MKRIISLILCLIMLVTPAFSADNSADAQSRAEDLKALNLFFGVSGDNNFDLQRAPTRIEALVMLIRVLGAEKEALNGTWKHPFTDVPAWADKYVGYGYQKGLANGVGLTTFGTGQASAAMYLTFVLRALGYSEVNDGFTWDKPFDIARQIGILTSQVNTEKFLRADVVLVSYAALDREIKGQGKTLAEKLISAGVFTKNQYDAHYDVKTSSGTKKELNAEEIYNKCSQAVFLIEVNKGKTGGTGFGSGFFITSDGIAVTNYHVIEGATSAKIKLPDSQKEYNVEGVLSYSTQEDWAVIKVTGSGFATLTIGDQSTITGGANIYAIGNPLTLQNTISQGIISNVSREIEGSTYIQITAPISNGSSGGALINKYGEVIGITTMSASMGQNVNMAVPISKIKNYTGASVIPFSSIKKTITPSEVLSILYQIATQYSTFQYEDYIGWHGKSNGGQEEMEIVYSKTGNAVFIDYDIYVNSEADCNMVILFDTTEAGKDDFLFTVYPKNATLPGFVAEGTITRGELTSESGVTISSYESNTYLSADDIKAYTKTATLTTCLAIGSLDEILQLFTDGEVNIEHLGYKKLYE